MPKSLLRKSTPTGFGSVDIFTGQNAGSVLYWNKETKMTQIAVNDRVIENARAVTTLTDDREIVEAALDSFTSCMKSQLEAIEIIKEMQNEPGYVGWDPEFAGWDKRDIK
jgi:hypothetical protein